MKLDELGPEGVFHFHDPRSGMRAVLVVDNSVLGPCGGGTRMLPDLTVQEVADLARGMTYKFAIFDLPRGGSKAGIIADPRMPAERRQAILQAFGRAVAPLLRNREVAIGPDMGVSVEDVSVIYEGAGVPSIRSGMFSQLIEGDAAAYHLTGYGVIVATRAACASVGRSLEGATIAVEGFGQVGAGAARYAANEGARVVAVTTVDGGVHDPNGLDIDRLLELRRKAGDACVLRYLEGEAGDARPLAPEEIYFLPADIVVPGARPYVLNRFNVERVQAKIVCPAANIAVTEEAEKELERRGIVCTPDFVTNAGGALASWVDFLRGTPQQALAVIERLIGKVTADILEEAGERRQPPAVIARDRVLDKIMSSNRERPSFDEISAQIRTQFGL